MGYDLHVVRTSDWLDAEKSSITREDVFRLVASDPELEWSKTDNIDMQEKNGNTVRFPVISWRAVSCFWWYQDQIICKNPDPAQMAKLIRIADALKAQVIGDDGEKYVLKRSLFGREKVQTIQP
jgi:hypothetical protein